MKSRTQPVTLPRAYPPAPLVGTAVAVFNPQGEVLLVLRAREPSAGMWGLPGGLLDLGERLADGARREVREECGVEIEIGDVAGVFEPIVRDNAGRVQYHYVVIDFWGRYVSGELRPDDDAAAAEWIPLEGLEALSMQEETRRIIRVAHRKWEEASG